MPYFELHPYLRNTQNEIANGHCCVLFWDVRSAPFANNLRNVVNPGMPVTVGGLAQSATNPPVSRLNIVCGLFPETWHIQVSNAHGVNVGDVLNAIYSCLDTPLRQEEWSSLSTKERSRVSTMYEHRCRYSTNPTVAHSQGVLRVDYVVFHTYFNGLSVIAGDVDNTCILSLRRFTGSEAFH